MKDESAKALALGLVLLSLPAAHATHDEGCTPSSADPASYNVVDLTGVGQGYFYVEERGGVSAGVAVVPGSGLLPGGQGTWVYEERNGVAGLQRGGIGILGASFPPPPLPGIIDDEDDINDENCGHGSDRIIV